MSVRSTLSSSSEVTLLMHLESMQACFMMSLCAEHIFHTHSTILVPETQLWVSSCHTLCSTHP